MFDSTDKSYYPTIYYQNVRGLRTKTIDFYCNLLRNSFDIIVLTETWLVDGIYDSELFDSRYVVWRRDRDLSLTGQSLGGGVIIAIRRDLSVIPQPTYQSSAEDLWVTLSLKSPGNRTTNLHLCVLYLCKQNEGNSFSLQLQNFLNKLGKVRLSNPVDKFLIIGDFNLSNISWTMNHEFYVPTDYSTHDECALIDELSVQNLKQYNGIVNKNDRILDLVLCNDIVMVSECFEPLVPLDPYHKALIISIQFIPFARLESASHLKYFYNRANYDLINAELLSINWDNEFSHRTLDQCVEFFYNKFRLIRDQHVPSKLVTSGTYPIWYTSPLKKAIREKKISPQIQIV